MAGAQKRLRATAESVLTDAGELIKKANFEWSGVRVVLGSDDGTEEAECRFLAGCDGSDSTVRRAAGVDFVGGSHHEEVVLADVDLDGLPDDGRLHVTVGASGLVWLFPLGEGAPWRLLATRPASATRTTTWATRGSSSTGSCRDPHWARRSPPARGPR